MERPRFSTAIPKRRYRYGDYNAVVLGDIESTGSAQYRPTGEPGVSTDLGGCVNMLNTKESITKKGHGMKPNSVLIQVEKWTGADDWQPTAETI